MDKIELLKELENMGEIEPDKYDGSYELMREIIKSYSGLDNYDKCTYLDINAIYMMSVGTWKFNIQKKRSILVRVVCQNQKRKDCMKYWIKSGTMRAIRSMKMFWIDHR